MNINPGAHLTENVSLKIHLKTSKPLKSNKLLDSCSILIGYGLHNVLILKYDSVIFKVDVHIIWILKLVTRAQRLLQVPYEYSEDINALSFLRKIIIQSPKTA